MTEQSSARLPSQRTSLDEECRLENLKEALARGEKPSDSLGTVACLACYGIFRVDVDRGVVNVEPLTSIPCMLERPAASEVSPSDTHQSQ